MYLMNEQKVRLALVGKDVSKSLSADIHAFILGEWGYSCEYELVSAEKEDFDSVLRRLLGDFDGFNVTIPYKRDVMAYLNEVSGDAMDFGAVNTVVTRTMTGYNTDGVGFLHMLHLAKISVQDKKVLVLGGGGAGRSTAAALKKAGATVSVYQRRREKLEEVCKELGVNAAENPESGEYDMLINCTGVGMHQTVGISPVSERAFDGASVAVDLIYTPTESEFLRLAKMRGLQTLNGAAMLFYQAYFSDCLYVNREPMEGEVEELYQKYLQKMTEAKA